MENQHRRRGWDANGMVPRDLHPVLSLDTLTRDDDRALETLVLAVCGLVRHRHLVSRVGRMLRLEDLDIGSQAQKAIAILVLDSRNAIRCDGHERMTPVGRAGLGRAEVQLERIGVIEAPTKRLDVTRVVGWPLHRRRTTDGMDLI